MAPDDDIEMEPVGADTAIRDAGLRRVLSLWTAKRPSGRLPARGDLLPEELGPTLPAVLLLDVVGKADGRDYVYRVAGSRLVEMYGVEPTGRPLSDFAEWPWAQRARRIFDRAVDSGMPTLARARMTVEPRDFYRVETLCLPLAAEGATVDMLLVAMAFEPDGREG